MNRGILKGLAAVAVAALLLARPPSSAAATLDIYISAPSRPAVVPPYLPNGTQTNQLPPTEAGTTTVETFENTTSWPTTGTYTSVTVSRPIGTYTIGTGAQQLRIMAADQFGAAGGTGRYMAPGTANGISGPIQLQFASAQNYFGFWWSAGDAGNQVEVYSGGTLLATLTTAGITTLLAAPTVTALDGTNYDTGRYRGNPNTAFGGQNAAENYAYVSIFGNGTTFDRVDFRNTGTGGSFENDNHAISSNATLPGPGSPLVFVSTIPEPSTLAGLGLATVAAGATWFGRRRARAS